MEETRNNWQKGKLQGLLVRGKRGEEVLVFRVKLQPLARSAAGVTCVELTAHRHTHSAPKVPGVLSTTAQPCLGDRDTGELPALPRTCQFFV